jgi:hypothetical protein
MWLESRDDGTDDADGENPAIHQVGVVVLRPDDADGRIYPDEDECCCERNANGGSVCAIACHPRCQLIGDASAEDQGGGESEVGLIPVHFIGNLHREQGQQDERCGSAPGRYPPTAPEPSAIVFRVSCHCLVSVHA